MTDHANGLEHVAGLVERDHLRHRSPFETKPALTQAYARLALAIGFARLGARERTRNLEQQALEALVPLGDPLHDTIVACYRFRIDEANALRPSTWDLSGSVVARFSVLKRGLRYHLDRLLDHVEILEPNRVRDSDGLVDIWKTPGRPLRARSDTDPRTLLRNARWDMGLLAKRIDQLSDEQPRQYVVAGARSVLTDPRGAKTFEEGLARLNDKLSLPDRLALARAVAAGASYCELETGRAYLARVADLYRTTTDSYGQNSHFCISVLELVDALVIAHTELELSNHPDRTSPLLATGFVF
jgi:hypothetical protein